MSVNSNFIEKIFFVGGVSKDSLIRILGYAPHLSKNCYGQLLVIIIYILL
jgi:hypothetical protein